MTVKVSQLKSEITRYKSVILAANEPIRHAAKCGNNEEAFELLLDQSIMKSILIEMMEYVQLNDGKMYNTDITLIFHGK